MKKIAIIVRTETRYGNISQVLKDKFPIINKFIATKTILNFKANQLFQFLFPTPDLLIIDEDILAGQDHFEKPINLLEKILSMGVLDKKTKILLLVDSKEVANLKNTNSILLQRRYENHDFPIFTFSSNAKGDEKVMGKLFEKISEMLI